MYEAKDVADEVREELIAEAREEVRARARLNNEELDEAGFSEAVRAYVDAHPEESDILASGMTAKVELLANFLKPQPSGRLHGKIKQAVIPLLVACWDELEGSDEQSTYAYKLHGRIENLTWDPPVLTFTIERHGGTVHGSAFADLHHWQVDPQRGTATCSVGGRRRLSAAPPRINTEALAERLAKYILKEAKHRALKWAPDDGTVRLLIGKVIEAGDLNVQTLAGRRKRFRTALRKRLPEWREIKPNVWKPA
jgi:hypothetical protein